MAPAHHAVWAHNHQRTVGHPARLEVRPELLRGLALGLEVRELLDRDAELLLERDLRVRRIGRDAVERRALRLQIVERLLVDLQLIGADRAEREGIEDEDGGLAQQVLAGEVVAVLAREGELRSGGPGGDDAHRRSPSSRISSRYPLRSLRCM